MDTQTHRQTNTHTALCKGLFIYYVIQVGGRGVSQTMIQHDREGGDGGPEEAKIV